ncbi:flagellar basal body-associated protein FliL [Halomonas sp. PR-M31]|uniref:flagellar basal body-associated protein FliL n=1 Tax=Halomonas sp. PR-M31 TaxID=1471202 RepID=UPI0006517617|nr:flagellar basal body-associated protein FliL [Halomonas sp. PR-M31]
MAKNQSDKKGGKPWWLLGIVIIAISMASSAGVYYLLDLNNPVNADESAPEEAEAVVAAAPIFATVSPFTVNVQSENYEQRLLYIGLSFKVGNEETASLIAQNMPQLRSRLLLLLSDQYAEELTRPAGKEALVGKILALFDEPFSDPQPELAIDDVLYTDFIVQ